MDAVDAVLVCFHANGSIETCQAVSTPFPKYLHPRLQAIIKPNWLGSLKEIAEINALLGELYANTAQAVIKKSSIAKEHICAIGNHGQTIWHQPDQEPRFSWQLGDANQIAETTGVTTVADFRNRDIAAGGEGAPLVPAFHEAVFAAAGKNRVIVNIGGISNVSILSPGQATSGFDTGPGNGLMDAWCQQNLNKPYDHNGEWAMSGHCIPALLAKLLSDPYFCRPFPKSTGKEYFNLEWLAPHLSLDLPANDIQATLLELTAVTIQQSILSASPNVNEVYLCGGGTKNAALFHRLSELMPGIYLAKTDVLGVDADWVEAVAFAWLAKQTLHGLPGNLASATGASGPRILGAIYQA